MTCTTCNSVNSHLGKLRLVITNTSKSWGGNEQYALMVATGLAAQGLAVLFLWSDPVVGQRVVKAGLENKQIKLRADGDLIGLASLARDFQAFNANAVLLTRWREYFLGGIAAKLARVRCISLRIGLRIIPANDLKRRLIFSMADKVIVNAEEIRTSLLKRSWIDEEKIDIIHNGVDTNLFQPGSDGISFRDTLGISRQTKLVLTIGSMNDQKNHELFIRSAADVLRQQTDTVFVIIGDGFLRGKLQNMLVELNLEHKVLMPGFLDDIRPALAAADLFVLSSRNEGMARVLIEALACGKAIVTTDVSGARNCVHDGINGLVVPSEQSAPLSEAINTILDNPALAKTMGLQSRELALKDFQVDKMIRRTAETCLSQGT